MSPDEEDEEFWGSLRRITSESEKTQDQTTAAPEETGPEAAGSGSTDTLRREEETATARPEPSEDVDQEAAEEQQAPVPREKILQRINSKKEMKSYQLG